MKTGIDLAEYHQVVGEMFPTQVTKEDWEKYKLNDDQIAFFNENGYLANVKVLDDVQIDQLNEELAEIADPGHPKHHLFYEFHSNESSDPNTVLFHSLGHWRITPGFHDVLWNPALLFQHLNC